MHLINFVDGLQWFFEAKIQNSLICQFRELESNKGVLDFPYLEFPLYFTDCENSLQLVVQIREAQQLDSN